MITRRINYFLAAALCVSGIVVKADDVPPNTGACASRASCSPTQDKNYLIFSDSTQSPAISIPTGGLPAYIVQGPLAQYWAGDPSSGVPGTGGAWIAPDPNQTNLSTHSVKGVTIYQLTFMVTDETKANLGITVAADDFLVIQLQNSGTGGSAQTIFTSNGAMYSYTVPGTLDRTSSKFVTNPAQPSNTIGLKNGANTMYFAVTNGGPGPTGLSVAFHGTLGGAAVTGVTTAPATNHGTVVNDPVDSATGQLYDTITDLDLGGPLGFQFARYYSSTLSSAGFSSALGLNWMSNFDVSLGITGSTANVLLFGGKVVTFTNTGSAWQLASPLDIVYQLATSGSNYKFMDPTSRLIYTFSTAGTLTRIEDRNGNALTITPGPFGPTSISDSGGRSLALLYISGQLAEIVDQGNRTTQFGYNGIQLVSSTDDAGKATNYTYTSSGGINGINGLLVSKQLPVGNTPTVQAYDSTGRVITQTDGNKNVTKIAYSTGQTTVTNPSGAIKTQTTDPNGDLTTQVDPAGTAKFSLDSTNRLVSVTNRESNTTAMSYHAPTGYLASITDALGNTTAYSYIAQTHDVFTFYNRSGVTYPDGTSESFTYDANGNVASHTAQDGSITTYTYDASGHLLTSTNPNKAVTTYTWNADATIATQTDALGNQTTFAYDALKRVTKITDPNGGVSTFFYTYGGDGSRISVAAAAGLGSTTLYYDFNGQPQDYVNPSGGVFHSAYTATENIATFTDAAGNKTTTTYNAIDQPATVTDPAGVVTTLGYDAAGHNTTISNSSGPIATMTYTPEGRVATLADGAGNKTSFTYDADGRKTSLTTAGGSKFAYSYDKLGNLLSATDPLGGSESLTLDHAGRFTQVTTPGAISTSVTRDAAGNITAIVTPNGNKWSIGYDTTNRVSTLTDPLGNATTYSYMGTQLTGMKSPLGNLALIVDKAGHITKRAYSDGTVVNTAYDSTGRLTSADNVTLKRDTEGRPTNVNGIAITLDGDSRPATLTYASGKAITYTYDANGRLSSVADWVAGKTTFAYDAAGRLTTVTYPNGATNTYTYDSNGSLIKIAYGALGSISLTRDATGKITAADRSLPQAPSPAAAASGTFSYDAAGQLTSATSDALGRVTAQNGRAYVWNLASQLTSFNDAVNSASFTYDGLGELNTMTTGSTTRSFVFNYLLPYPALSIVRQGGSDLRYYVYTPEGKLLYSIEADNTRHFYHFDEMGNTVMLTDGTGAMSDGYAITPYGEIAVHAGTADNPFTWQGQYGAFQEGTSLFYMRSRHYDASTARFISRDPVMSADPRGSEPYAYADGNPLLYTDPFGSGVDLSKLSPLQIDALTAALKADPTGSSIDLSKITPLQVDTLLSLFKIDTSNIFGQILIAIFNIAVEDKSVSWKTVATDLGLDSTAPIVTFLNAEIVTLLTAKTPAVTTVAVATKPPANPPVRSILSLPDTGKSTSVPKSN